MTAQLTENTRKPGRIGSRRCGVWIVQDDFCCRAGARGLKLLQTLFKRLYVLLENPRGRRPRVRVLALLGPIVALALCANRAATITFLQIGSSVLVFATLRGRFIQYVLDNHRR